MTTKYRIYEESNGTGKMYFTGEHWYGLGYFNQPHEAYVCDSKEEAEQVQKWLEENITPQVEHRIEDFDDEL